MVFLPEFQYIITYKNKIPFNTTDSKVIVIDNLSSAASVNTVINLAAAPAKFKNKVIAANYPVDPFLKLLII